MLGDFGNNFLLIEKSISMVTLNKKFAFAGNGNNWFTF